MVVKRSTEEGGQVVEVSPLVWGLTLGAIVGLLLFDFFFHVRKAHVPTLREAAIWSALYVGIAVVFGLGVLSSAEARRAGSTSAATSPRRHSRSTTCSSSSSS
jgi:hypothetical protein